MLPESMVQTINTNVTAQRVLRLESNPNSYNSTLLQMVSSSHSLLTPTVQVARERWKVLGHKLR